MNSEKISNAPTQVKEKTSEIFENRFTKAALLNLAKLVAASFAIFNLNTAQVNAYQLNKPPEPLSATQIVAANNDHDDYGAPMDDINYDDVEVVGEQRVEEGLEMKPLASPDDLNSVSKSAADLLLNDQPYQNPQVEHPDWIVQIGRLRVLMDKNNTK